MSTPPAHGQPAGSVPLRRVVARLVRPRWRAVAVLALSSLAAGLLEAAFLYVLTKTAFAIAEGADDVVLAGRAVSRAGALALALGLVVAKLAATLATTWQSARLGSGVTAGIRRSIAKAFLRARWSAQQGERGGRLQELLTTFAQQGATLIAAVASATTAGFNLLALLVSAVIVDPASSVVVIVAVALIAAALRPVRAAIRRQAATNSSAGMAFATSLHEVSQLGMETHVFGVGDAALARVDGLVTDNARSHRRLRFLQGLVPALYTGLAYLAVVGALTVVALLDRSDLSAVGAVMLIMLRSLTYGQGLQTAVANVYATAPFVDALDAELARFAAAARRDGTVAKDGVGEITARGVGFSYTPGTPVLRGVDFTIGRHEVVGIVGPSGSGKSTLVQLLLGLQEPTEGRILADGVDIADIRRADWSRLVTFVPQQAHLFAGTVADNIRFLRDDVGAADVERAARLAHLHDDIVSWDEGYDRQVGEHGGSLSGGQQQRVVIARALVERPDVLVLDEPTSALDVRSEALVRDTLQRLSAEMTIVVIAHRLSTLEICDRIMVVQDGEVKAFDTPERLERTSGFYREALILSGLR